MISYWEIMTTRRSLLIYFKFLSLFDFEKFCHLISIPIKVPPFSGGLLLVARPNKTILPREVAQGCAGYEAKDVRRTPPGDLTFGSPHCNYVTTGRGHSASLLQVYSFVHPAQMTL